MRIMRIGYFADGPWGYNAFQRMINDAMLKIVFVMVRYDKQDPVLVEYARKYNIPLLLSENVNGRDFLESVKKYEADIFVSMSFNQIFKSEFINTPPLGTINCHAGKLPYYRGRNILNWALINDEKEFGITVHYVDEGIDTGDIILQRVFPITDEDDYGTLLNVAHTACADILYDALKEIQNGTAQRIRQSEIRPVGMYCGMRKEGDERMSWNQTSREVFNFVRAICPPGPGARCWINDAECRVDKVEMVENAPVYKGIPGQVIGKEGPYLLVKTTDTFVKVMEYQCERKIKVGDRFLCHMS